MNPARDLGPRIVHWAMPIPGKGSSGVHHAATCLHYVHYDVMIQK